MQKPLYILAKEKILPENQYMDRETLEWIEIHSKQYSSVTGSRDIANIALATYDILRPLLPLQPTLFFRGPVALNSIHGELHAYRVALFSGMLSSLHTDSVVPYVTAGLYHDIARVNDKSDAGHGHRSAQRLDDLGLLGSTPDDKIIKEAIEYHDDSSIITDTMIHIKIIKTADALDRFRLPKQKWWPDPERIPLTLSDNMISFARSITLLSEKYALENNNLLAFDMAIREIAQKMEGK